MTVQTVDLTHKIRDAFRLLASTRVLVGIPSDSEQPHLGVAVDGGPRKDEGKKEITNAELAYIHSNGAPERNIPARPFLEPGIEEVKDDIEKRFRDGAEAALRGDVAAVDKNLDAVGLIAQAAARNKIAQGIPPPLSPRTVAARMRRTKKSKYSRTATPAQQAAFNDKFYAGQATMAESPTTPLLDTGQLLHAISYVKRTVK